MPRSSDVARKAQAPGHVLLGVQAFLASAALALLLVPTAAAAGGIAITASVPDALRVAGPQETVTFPVEFRSQSDRDVILRFEVVNRSDDLQVVAPVPLKIPRGQAAPFHVDVMAQTPYHNGYVNEVGAFTLHVIPHAADDETVTGAPKDLSFLVTTRGWYVPGPGAMVLVAAMGALALLVRRRVHVLR